MNRYKKIRGIIKVINSVFRNSSNIEYNGIKLPMSDNPTDSEIIEWCKETNNIVKKELEENDIDVFREKLLQDCSNKLENLYTEL